ncbi:bifunctional diguanylate cyclase/phosphodiesterase [uncultured Oceanisphaera sp.]|uniref:sensor domain-containing protein n=1 Tax=uncultured Oceanisphaera sp. TaxID=353858 RepID=UPI00260BDE0D|nr:diguanylate cyclase [uncultured Oceanisphaera sp.]
MSMMTLDYIESGIMLLDSERRVRFWNQWLVRYTGIDADTAGGQRLEQLFDGPLPPVVLSAIGDACEHRLSRLLSHQLHTQLLPLHGRTVSGARTPIHHSMLLRPLDDAEGLTLVQLHDTTNAVRRERHLRDKEQALRKVHQVLTEEKQFIDTVLKTISALVVVTDTHGRIVNINRSCELQTGVNEEEVHGQPLKMLLGLDSLKHLPDGRGHHDEPRPFTCRMSNAGGESMHVRWTIKAVRDGDQLLRYLIYTGQDITERERSDALLRLEREMLEMATAGEQPANILTHLCLALERQLDCCRVAVLQMDTNERLRVDHAPGLPESFSQRLYQLQTDSLLRVLRPGLQQGQLQVFVAKEPGTHWQSWLTLARDYEMNGCWLMPIQLSTQMSQSLLAVFPRHKSHPGLHEQMVIQRISHLTALILERQQQQEQIQYLALHDSLTGLANRSLLNEQLMRSIHRARREQQSFALLFIDLDGFKMLNDTHGHDAGDALLTALGQRLINRFRATDCCARIGGDEFVILLDSVNDEKVTRDIAESILALLSAPLSWGEHQLQVSASIGIAVYPQDGDSADELLSRADNAMYGAKAGGKGRVCRLADEARSECP